MFDTRSSMSNAFILAFDLGGTNVSAAVFDLAHRRIGDVEKHSTMADKSARVILENLKRTGEQALQRANAGGFPVAVGIGSKGPVDSQTGVLRAPSLPQLMNFNLAKFIEDEFHAPLYLEKNANCFALGEALVGAGRGHSIVVGVTLGTGFGCGIVFHGKIYSGATGNAGELEWCRAEGVKYDDALSGAGVSRIYSSIAKGVSLLPKELADLARKGDGTAKLAWEQYGESVGEAVGKIAALLDPSVIVLGGSVAQQWALFQHAFDRQIRLQLAFEAAEKLSIFPAALGNASGITGAAEYAFQRMASSN